MRLDERTFNIYVLANLEWEPQQDFRYEYVIEFPIELLYEGVVFETEE